MYDLNEDVKNLSIKYPTTTFSPDMYDPRTAHVQKLFILIVSLSHCLPVCSNSFLFRKYHKVHKLIPLCTITPTLYCSIVCDNGILQFNLIQSTH